MSASGVEQRAAFRRASLPDPAAEGGSAEILAASADLVVRPTLSIDQAKELWNSYLDFKSVILADPDCADDIGGKREMNRTGATRLATAFGLSIEMAEIQEGRVQLADTGDYDYRFLVRVRVGKGRRWVDGIASCRLSEIPERTKKGEEVPIS